MINIFLTGSNGFLGKNFIKYFDDVYSIKKYNYESDLVLLSDVVINFAGKAHDVRNVSNSDDYYLINTSFSNKLFDAFLSSNAKVFITISSVKAVADVIKGELNEMCIPAPFTQYGKSKLMAEEYITPFFLAPNKRIYILRPCMIHGPGNKGNLNLLYNLVSKGIPWPLGAFENNRSFCSIDNLMFIIKELIERQDIPSGIYNIADDVPLSTNQLISILAESQDRPPKIWNISKKLIQFLAKIGNVLKLPLNEERLQKLTDSYVVSNQKIKSAIGKPLPVSSKEGLLKTFKSFN